MVGEGACLNAQTNLKQFSLLLVACCTRTHQRTMIAIAIRSSQTGLHLRSLPWSNQAFSFLSLCHTFRAHPHRSLVAIESSWCIGRLQLSLKLQSGPGIVQKILKILITLACRRLARSLLHSCSNSAARSAESAKSKTTSANCWFRSHDSTTDRA